MKELIETDDAAAAVGAYSQATATDSLVFTAGQIPFTSEGDSRADAPITTQTELVLDNLESVLEEAGCELSDVVKTTIFLADIDDFDAMNETYADYFDEEPPARSAVQAGALPKGVGVEIEAIAMK
jgi:2-iminobutanoate/2-iminopropanoate deaminase